jgi:pimeloyl-ACP methyl ester carboxylesterase
MMNRIVWWIGPALATALVGCGVEHVEETTARSQAIEESPDGIEGVITITHPVVIGPQRRVMVRESFSLAALQRSPRRAVLFIQGTPTTGDFYNMPIDGYRGRERMAAEGYFAYTIDLEGSGASTYPEDGLSLTFDVQTESMRAVVDFIRTARQVPLVDLYGEGEGGGIASQLCADDTRIRSCTLSSMLYKQGTDAFNAFFNSPQFRALIFGTPNGYLDTTAALYFNVLAGAPPEVASWVLANQPGRYSMGLIAEELVASPSYDPTHARVPGLIIRGEFDQNAPASDTAVLAAEYGSAGGAAPAQIVTVPGALMLPRIEAAPHNEQLWAAFLAFLE